MRGFTGMRAALAALAVVLLGGCAASQQMSSEDRAKVKSAKIGAVEKQQLFLLAPGGANIGLMFGAIGGAASSGAIEDSRKAFQTYLDKNGISVEKIVREELEQALRASGKLAIVADSDAAAPLLKTTVIQYGFGVPHLVSSNVVPVMSIKCDLVDASGRVLWSGNDRMGPSIANKVQPTTWEELSKSPKLIEEKWRQLAQILAKNIVGEL
jgi:hypothetical protein